MSVVITSFFKSTPLTDLMPLFGIIGLMIGGLVLISSAIPRRADILARRFSRAVVTRDMSGPGGNKSTIQPTSLQLPGLAGGLKEVEQRQVIRLLSRFHVKTERAITVFIFLRGISAFCFGLLGFVAVVWFGTFGSSKILVAIVGLGSAMAGWMMPLILIARSLSNRTQAIGVALPGALELLVVCVEAGLSLEDALEQVSQELMYSERALAEELAITWAEVNILPNRLQAFRNLADRVNISSVRSIIGMLAQSMEFGTPLAQSLRVCATEMRNEQLRLMEERASKLPALMTLPVMLFILPTMFLIIGGPVAIRIMDSFHAGIN